MTGCETMKKTIWVTASIAAVLVFAWWAKGQLAIDSCLDSGGRWNYEKSVCER
jgi:hypothetical protein